jgi:hypothetical protein
MFNLGLNSARVRHIYKNSKWPPYNDNKAKLKLKFTLRASHM